MTDIFDRRITANHDAMMAERVPVFVETWRESASAPKTGEHILVSRFGGRGFGLSGGKWADWCAVVHYWSNPGEEGFYLSSGASNDIDDQPVGFTHWMPIPAERPEGERNG